MLPTRERQRRPPTQRAARKIARPGDSVCGALYTLPIHYIKVPMYMLAVDIAIYVPICRHYDIALSERRRRLLVTAPRTSSYCLQRFPFKSYVHVQEIRSLVHLDPLF